MSNIGSKHLSWLRGVYSLLISTTSEVLGCLCVFVCVCVCLSLFCSRRSFFLPSFLLTSKDYPISMVKIITMMMLSLFLFFTHSVKMISLGLVPLLKTT